MKQIDIFDEITSFMRFFLIFFLAGMSLQAQNFPAVDSIYLDEIKSLAIYPRNIITGYPIVDLNRNQLKIEFDDITGQFAQYTYSFFHCDKDWNYSTEIQDFDFRNGFVEEEIFDYFVSNGTDVPYHHYELVLPNNKMSWRLSGNYILVVYKDDGDKRIAFTRRIFVVDPILDINIRVQRPVNQSISRTHHEIDFFATYEDFTVRNPFKEVSAQIYQNGIWENGYREIPPINVSLNTISFDYQNQIVFPAWKEFRYFDVRNIQFRTERVFEIYRSLDTIHVVLKTDRPRGDNYFTYFDINGKFVLQNMDAASNYVDHSTEDENIAQVLAEDEMIMDQRIDLLSEYVNVHFSLNRQQFPDKEVFIVGAFNNWKLDDNSKMDYAPEDQVYYKELLLKQGYYEYMYVTKDIATGEISWTDIEGSRFETINDYLIFIYYRPFGTFYDQLIGMFTYESTGTD
jgi:hypothetical protein